MSGAPIRSDESIEPISRFAELDEGVTFGAADSIGSFSIDDVVTINALN